MKRGERDITTGGAKVAVVSSARELEVQVRYVLGIQAAAEKGLEQFPAPKEPIGLPPDAERATPRIEDDAHTPSCRYRTALQVVAT